MDKKRHWQGVRKEYHFLRTKMLQLLCLLPLPGYILNQGPQSNGCVWRKYHSFSEGKSLDSLEESDRS